MPSGSVTVNDSGLRPGFERNELTIRSRKRRSCLKTAWIVLFCAGYLGRRKALAQATGAG